MIKEKHLLDDRERGQVAVMLEDYGLVDVVFAVLEIAMSEKNKRIVHRDAAMREIKNCCDMIDMSAVP